MFTWKSWTLGSVIWSCAIKCKHWNPAPSFQVWSFHCPFTLSQKLFHSSKESDQFILSKLTRVSKLKSIIHCCCCCISKLNSTRPPPVTLFVATADLTFFSADYRVITFLAKNEIIKLLTLSQIGPPDQDHLLLWKGHLWTERQTGIHDEAWANKLQIVFEQGSHFTQLKLAEAQGYQISQMDW